MTGRWAKRSCCMTAYMFSWFTIVTALLCSALGPSARSTDECLPAWPGQNVPRTPALLTLRLCYCRATACFCILRVLNGSVLGRVHMVI